MSTNLTSRAGQYQAALDAKDYQIKSLRKKLKALSASLKESRSENKKWALDVCKLKARCKALNAHLSLYKIPGEPFSHYASETIYLWPNSWGNLWAEKIRGKIAFALKFAQYDAKTHSGVIFSLGEILHACQVFTFGNIPLSSLVESVVNNASSGLRVIQEAVEDAERVSK